MEVQVQYAFILSYEKSEPFNFDGNPSNLSVGEETPN